MAEEGNAHELPLGEVGLLGVLELDEHVAPILVQNLYLLDVSVVAEQVEQVRYLLFVVFCLWQVLYHQHPSEVLLPFLLLMVPALVRAMVPMGVALLLIF